MKKVTCFDSDSIISARAFCVSWNGSKPKSSSPKPSSSLANKDHSSANWKTFSLLFQRAIFTLNKSICFPFLKWIGVNSNGYELTIKITAIRIAGQMVQICFKLFVSKFEVWRWPSGRTTGGWWIGRLWQTRTGCWLPQTVAEVEMVKRIATVNGRGFPTIEKEQKNHYRSY